MLDDPPRSGRSDIAPICVASSESLHRIQNLLTVKKASRGTFTIFAFECIESCCARAVKVLCSELCCWLERATA